MDQDITNQLFSTFETDDGDTHGADLVGGNQEFNVEGDDAPKQPPTDDANDGEHKEDESKDGDFVRVKKAEWDHTQQVLSEFKGFMAASQSRKPERTEERVETPPQPRVDPQQQQAALDQVFQKIGEKMIEDPKEGAKMLFALQMQASAQQAAQYAAPAATSAVDLMVENFVTRKQSKDPLYEKGVGEKFEAMIDKIDTRVAAGASRAQLNEALETLYQRAKGDWADEQYTKAQQNRKTPARQEATNYGGGKSAGGSQAGQRMTIPDSWKAFAVRAGFSENEITPDFFKQAEE